MSMLRAELVQQHHLYRCEAMRTGSELMYVAGPSWVPASDVDLTGYQYYTTTGAGGVSEQLLVVSYCSHSRGAGGGAGGRSSGRR